MINSLMRTLVPAIYLGLIHLGLSKDIPQAWVLDLISLAVLAAVYLLLRLLEQKWRMVGLLLGWIGAPSYDTVDQAKAATADELHGALARVESAIVEQIKAHVTAATTPKPVVLSYDSASSVTTPVAAKKTTAKRPARKAPAKKAAPKQE